MARSRSRSPARSRRHGGSSSSSRRDRHASSSRRRSGSRSRRLNDPVASLDDKNGEIALSIDETNQLRLSLGLKPLALGLSAKEQAVVSVQKTSAQLDAEREQHALQKKLQQSKTRRELTHKLVGQSLGEQLKAELEAKKSGKMQLHDALEWVKQSRQQRKKDLARQSESEDSYDATALAGMTVGHSVDHFEDGEDVILTLKDQQVLADGKALNEHEDILVNVKLSEKDRWEARQMRAKRAAMPVYSGYDDDEFIEIGSSRKRKNGVKLLAQYDEEEDALEVEEANKFQLDASGGTKRVEKETKEEEEVTVISLAINRTKRVEEYYTKEEVAEQFAKRKKSKKVRRKKTLRRQTEGLEDEGDVPLKAGLDDEEARDLVARLEQEATQTGTATSNDRGKRTWRTEEEDAEEDEKLRRFQEARNKANAVAVEALAATSRSSLKRKRRRIDESEMLDDAVTIERELGASLARARQLTQQKQTLASGTSEDRITQLVSQTVRNEEESTPDVDSVDVTKTGFGTILTGQVFGDVDPRANTVVFNEATDFETRLRDAMEKRAAQFQAAAEKPAGASQASWSGKDHVAVVNEPNEKEENKKSSEDEEIQESEVWGEEEPLVGVGVGATLALLRKTGDLRQTRVERQAGRANDARDRAFEADLRIKNGVKLDYRDEFGRLLTKKEAFRMLSYKFHGHEPGKKKKEKRLRQVKEELEAQKMLSGEGSTQMMKVLEKKQKHTKEAHVVLSSG